MIFSFIHNGTPIQIPINEYWSFSILKSELPKCDYQIGLINLNKMVEPCVFETDVLQKKIKVEKMENDGKAFISLIIKNKDIVPDFTLTVDDNEIFVFEKQDEEINDFEELLLSLNNYKISYEVAPFGIRLYFDIKYTSKEVVIDTEELYFLNSKFCLYRNDYVKVCLMIEELGKYQLVVLNGNEILSRSNCIEVINFIDKNTVILEYIKNGFYHRYRETLRLLDEEFQTEESETILSTGEISIRNTLIRPQQQFQTRFMESEGHRALIAVLKAGVKVNGERAKLRGEYSLQQLNNKMIGAGTLTFPDRIMMLGENCGQGCESKSSFNLVINDFKKAVIPAQVGVLYSPNRIVDEFVKYSGYTVILSETPDLTQTIRVYRNGLRRQTDEYSIVGTTVTFVKEFGSGVGGNPLQVETVIIDYNKI